ncbi:MAG: agmatine deiminase family protein [Halieaceae bacterium]|jgi:agmatine/peptidylarginine deiminase|nr:agmatine deiminase family protein [Halieaceae bacterium]
MSKRLLAEWYPQDAIQIAWPHRGTDWARMLPEIEAFYYELVDTLSHQEQVVIAADPSLDSERIQAELSRRGANLGNVRWFEVATDNTWARDHGPIAIGDATGIELLDFEFNAWGGKYGSSLDNAINREIDRQHGYGAPLRQVDFVLEGGSIETDGLGTLLSTTTCLLNPNRNGGLTLAQVESRLREQLGIDRFLWLEHGHLAGDDTDAHVDTLARFVDADTIAYVQCGDTGDEHFEALAAMEAELQAFRGADGEPYHLVPLPLPAAIRNADGDRLPATYANFLISNRSILLPVYGDPQDQRAIAALSAVSGERSVVPVNCRAPIEEFGSLHCLTMQLPRGALTNA